MVDVKDTVKPMTWLVSSICVPSGESSWRLPMTWCEQNLQSDHWRYESEGVFLFQRINDQTFFLLKWGR